MNGSKISTVTTNIQLLQRTGILFIRIYFFFCSENQNQGDTALDYKYNFQKGCLE